MEEKTRLQKLKGKNKLIFVFRVMSGIFLFMLIVVTVIKLFFLPDYEKIKKNGISIDGVVVSKDSNEKKRNYIINYEYNIEGKNFKDYNFVKKNFYDDAVIGQKILVIVYSRDHSQSVLAGNEIIKLGRKVLTILQFVYLCLSLGFFLVPLVVKGFKKSESQV